MLSSSAQTRIKEVLGIAKGNRAEAERILKQLIDREPKFLRELVDPFLPGIIAHALGGGAMRPVGVSERAPKKLDTSQLSDVMKTLGKQLGESSPETRPAASANHTNALQAMMDAQASRKKDSRK
jgi:hypothetical protein